MKILNLLILLLTGLMSYFAPIGLTICMLMGFILIDTLVKVFSIFIISRREKRPFFDIFKSKILRAKFILKSFGYFILAVSVAWIDIELITPTIKWVLENFYNGLTIPTEALMANILIIIFCFMELSSINENYNVITRVDLFKKVSKIVIKTRDFIIDVMSFFKNLKTDIQSLKSTHTDEIKEEGNEESR